METKQAKIKVLSKTIINQIAAGEVITRPACLVRELMQNAIDAAATQITIEVWQEDEKITQLRIRDNGSGIAEEELELAFLKHTTSKVEKFEDIFSIQTLGFRGEALSSIASISRVEAVSSTDESGEGMALTLRGSKKEKMEVVPAQKGFVVTVSDLFFNTPVRKKFLKTIMGEKIAIKEEVVRQILATDHVDVSYIVYSNGHEISRLVVPALYSLKDKIFSLFKRQDLRGNLISVDTSSHGYQFSGYLTNQKCRMANRKSQFFFIGGRVIENPIFYKTLERVYAHILPSRRYPMAFIKVTFEGQRVDVNVHPTKKEVRFENAGEFSSALYAVTHQTVLNKILSGQEDSLRASARQLLEGGARDDEVKLSRPGQVFRDHGAPPRDSQFDWATKKTYESRPRISEAAKYYVEPSHPADEGLESEGRSEGHSSAVSQGTTASGSAEAVRCGAEQSGQPGVAAQKSSVGVPRDPLSPGLKVLAQLEKCYIVFTLHGELYVVDQHAAHERINYNKIMQELDKEKIERMTLVVPLFYERSVSETDKIVANQEKLNKLGVSMEPFSKTVVSVSEVPQFIPEHKLEILISELLDVVIEDTPLEKSDFYRETIARMACRMSVMAGDVLSLLEMENLILSLYERKALLTCPHGRPFVKKIDSGELAKFFERTRHLR